MTISHHHRFIFLPVPKTGTTSVQGMLRDHGTLDEDGKIPMKWATILRHRIPRRRIYQPGEEVNRHRWALQAQELVGRRMWSRYFTFGFVRNPWSRMVSFYHFEVKNGFLDASTPFPAYIKAQCELVRGLERPGSGYSNLLPCSRWVGGCDFVGRLESFDQDLKTVLEKVGLGGLRPERLNTTSHRHYSTYYDDEARRLVGEVYRSDVEAFGYRFEEEGEVEEPLAG